ncbi:hypothetical protein G6L37_04135 [Agrobacterium rubi]|nr:hypothetical protein [Agrobacterium rubi]NTF24540.1 hypothetical protein [Agrobacterium rubi]
MISEKMLSFLVNTDFDSPSQLAISWGMALLTLAFGIYGWMYWDWSLMGIVGGILSIVLCIINPFRWLQRKLTGIIKRPSH